LVLWALSGIATAQQLYKCTTGGKVTYASAPCDGASVSVTPLAVPAAPAPDAAGAQVLARQKKLLAGFEKQRQAQDARDARASAVAARAGAVRRQRCARLELKKRWADETADRAAGFGKEALQDKARRMGEVMAVECPN
jgi:hypothetical protein